MELGVFVGLFDPFSFDKFFGLDLVGMGFGTHLEERFELFKDFGIDVEVVGFRSDDKVIVAHGSILRSG